MIGAWEEGNYRADPKVTKLRLLPALAQNSGAETVVNAVPQHLSNALPGLILKPFLPQAVALAGRGKLFE